MADEPGVVTIRRVRPEDVGRLQAIQLAAGNSFRDVGMPAVADSPPMPEESLAGYRRAGRAWVAADEHDEPVGFVVADVVDGSAHIEQVSVHPAHAGRQVVPARPVGERLGFHELAEPDITPGLAALAAAEPDFGLSSRPRVCMRRELPEPDPVSGSAHG